MAKHVILESYTFNPSTYTVTINGKTVRAEQLLLITNVTQGTVLYNFSDPSLGYSSFNNSVSGVTGLETTTIVLEYNTTAMSSTDILSILVEETYAEITPSETLRDPVDKLRTSQPQALIDTDFEYGPQPTKWEQLNLLNNRPSAFYDQTVLITATQITSITSDNLNKIVYVSCPFTLPSQSPIFVQGTLDQNNIDGWWVVNTSSVGGGFSFRTISSSTLTSVFDPTKTYIYPANFYTGAAIPVNAAGITVNATTSVSVTTTYAHGLRPGDGVWLANNTGAVGGITTGSFIVQSTWKTNIFTVFSTATVSGTITAVSTSSLYPRPLGYVEHRAYDGGVQFTNLSPYHGYQVIRQTRRYFRYQSGKGIQFSTGSSLKPQIVNEGLTANGTIVTVTSRYPHGLSTGSYIQVAGADQAAYNGIFPVTGVTSLTGFTYSALTTPSASPATGYPIIVNPYSWYGSSNRIGMFDNQNGFYFEYDGQTIWCVRRSSTSYLSGLATVTQGSNLVTGNSASKFSTQLKPNDYIVIRGQSYLVQAITSDTVMYIYPEYRGVSGVAITLNKTINTRYAGPNLAGLPNQWNIDKCDGTGASKFDFDLTKMQMFYVDYSWYGAGAIRFGFKNNRGEVIYCHRIPNNNLNPEAYMRSGNLPARYETNTIPGYTYLTQSLSNTAGSGNSIFVNDASLFPSSGTVAIKESADVGGLIEYISYSARTTSTITISSRAQLGGTSTAVTFNYLATAPIPVEVVSPTQASTISHWGSSVIMDGRFDDDKGFVFNTGMLTSVALPTIGVRYPLISVRLGPTVDSGTIGLLGQREIINRMQLTLRSMDCFNTGTTCRIDLILNGIPSAGTWTNVGGSSLAQSSIHAFGTTISGGESVYSFFTNNGAATSQELGLVRDIGNSILGGGTTSTVSNSLTAGNRYPDGPDILTVCATPITAPGATINARISWTEAQA